MHVVSGDMTRCGDKTIVGLGRRTYGGRFSELGAAVLRRMRTAKYVTAAVAAALVASLGGAATATSSPIAQNILVPSYITPGPGWDAIASSSPTVGIALL